MLEPAGRVTAAPAIPDERVGRQMFEGARAEKSPAATGRRAR